MFGAPFLKSAENHHKINMNLFLIIVLIYVGIILALYWIPYLLKKGWEDGRNASRKHARVCDMCFRNIEEWNKEVKKRAKGQIKT